jgi:hypothetical protein
VTDNLAAQFFDMLHEYVSRLHASECPPVVCSIFWQHILKRAGVSLDLGVEPGNDRGDFRSSACDIVLMKPYCAVPRTIAVDKFLMPQ